MSAWADLETELHIITRLQALPAAQLEQLTCQALSIAPQPQVGVPDGQWRLWIDAVGSECERRGRIAECSGPVPEHQHRPEQNPPPVTCSVPDVPHVPEFRPEDGGAA